MRGRGYLEEVTINRYCSHYFTVTGTVDAIALESPNKEGYDPMKDEVRVYWKQSGNNTGAVTITVDEGTTYPLKLKDGSDLSADMLLANYHYEAKFVTDHLELTSKTGVTYTSEDEIIALAKQNAGEVCYFAMSTPPTGFLKCNGSSISRTTYATLFSVIGTTFGAGDGSTTFNLPDLRGEFIRGWDDGRGVDSGRALGTTQDQNVTAHRHGIGGVGGGGSAGGDSYSEGAWDGGASHNRRTTQTLYDVGTDETRPRNVALLACIKY